MSSKFHKLDIPQNKRDSISRTRMVFWDNALTTQQNHHRNSMIKLSSPCHFYSTKQGKAPTSAMPSELSMAYLSLTKL